MIKMANEKITTAVILAAGESSRFYPFNSNGHKSMISLLGKPILAHTIERLRKAFVTNISIIVGKDENIKNYFGDGKAFGVNITYFFLPEATGMGNAVLLAKDHIQEEYFYVLAPYHLQIDTFIKELSKKRGEKVRAVLLAKKRDDVSGRGVLEIERGRVRNVVEKPKPEDAPSDICVVGIYLLSKAFLDTLSETPVEHYSFEKALSAFAKNHEVRFVEIKTETITLKYPWDIFSIQHYLLGSIKKSIGKGTRIAKSAEIIGDVVIDDHAIIMEGVKIKGPCYIGRGVKIGNNAIIRNTTDIEEAAVIGANMEVKNSLIMPGVTTHSGYIGDSVIGEGSKIAAQFCSANVRLDRKPVTVKVKDVPINTGLKSLGVMMGRNVKVGIKSSTMPGVIIGENSVIGSATNVLQNVSSNTTYYTKFQEVITKK